MLPYERQLIEIAGCSVEEYQQFIDEAMRRYVMRPAPPDGVPEVTAGFIVPALISLAVGVAVSAVSYLLTPKPRMPSASSDERGGGQQTLASTTGIDRFAQTSGFDSSAQLAEYGAPIPIIWTRYTGTTGGILVSPKLVWSRMFSEATHQAAKLLFVVGEGGVTAPEIDGIYIGNNSLRLQSDNNFAFYWSSTTRPTRGSQLYGRTGSGALAADPETTSDLFSTSAGSFGFSQAITPSNNTQFGVSNPIANGTQLRPDYKIVSIPASASNPDVLRRDRMKVAGFQRVVVDAANNVTIDVRKNGGLGYSYSRRLGISGYSSKQAVPIAVGTTITFGIYGGRRKRFFWGGGATDPGGDVTDIDNIIDNECAAADDQLQIGETIVIASSIWRVTGRSLPAWTPGQVQRITLTCVEILEASNIRVLDDDNIYGTSGDLNLHSGNPDQSFKTADETYDNLARISIASFRNTRPCFETQFGIRSQVWGRFSNLCNFNSLLDENTIERLDSENVSVQSGSMSDYFTRTSVFMIYYRTPGSFAWLNTNAFFCVRGSQPTDQFHQISALHSTSQVLEYRFVPLTAAYLARLPDSTTLYWLTPGVAETTISTTGVTLRARARAITLGQCRFLSRMTAGEPGTPTYRVFENSTGIAEVSFYGSLITRSSDNGPEHQLVYVNEIVQPSSAPSYRSLTMAALALRSNRSLSSLDQLRLWITTGVNASNSFPELVEYLLRNTRDVNSQLIDTASFASAKSYCASRGLFFDGAISDRSNLRQYIADTAPYFLLNFVIANGKFSLMPAIPAGLPNVTNLFTDGNIIENSFSVEFLSADQRRDFQALVIYRSHLRKNEFPVLRTYLARFSDTPLSAPIETFDISSFCTNRAHAEQVARYFLSVRRRITHAIKFKTAPDGANIAPGSYIKVALQQTVADTYGNGVISAVDGRVTSAVPMADGTYTIVYYQAGLTELQTGTVTISGGIALNTQLWGALFTIESKGITTGTYLVEQVEIDDDGLVNVTATEFPTAEINSDMAGTGIVVEET